MNIAQKKIWFFLCAIIVCAVNPLYADAFETYGLSAERSGMSGAGSAFSSDWTSAYYNPAGLSSPNINCVTDAKSADPGEPAHNDRIALTKTSKMPSDPDAHGVDEMGNYRAALAADCYKHDFGFSFSSFTQFLQINSAAGNDYQKSRAADALTDLNTARVNLGFNLDLRSFVKIPYDIPVHIGLAVGLDATGSLVKSIQADEDKYDFVRADANNRNISTTLAVSAQVWKDRLSLGFSPGSKSYIAGALQVSNLNLNPDNPPHIQAAFDAQTQSAPQGSLLYRQPISLLFPGDNLLVGMVFRYRQEATADLNLGANLPFGYSVQSAIVSNTIVSPDIYQLAIGYQHKDWRFALDADYQRWSQLAAAQAYQTPLDYNDIFITRLGAEMPIKKLLPRFFLADKTRVRTGYALIPPITPNPNGTANRLDNMKHLISLGLTAVMPAIFILIYDTKIDLSVQWQIWQNRNTDKSPAYFSNGSLQQNYNYYGNALLINLSLTWKI